MISPEEFTKKLLSLGIETTTGVPDSTFKGLISYFSSRHSAIKQITAVNECEALAIAAGNYLGSKKASVVYMQNSGFGKTVNPYTSLASKDVYSIPMLLLVGWRGEPGKKDEPQHQMMGRLTIELLTTLEIEHTILTENNWEDELEKAVQHTNSNSEPYALVIKKGLFDAFPADEMPKNSYTMTREEAIEIIAHSIPNNAMVVSTTGKASRELFEIREKLSLSHNTDFYTVGSMGCASSIAFGVGLDNPKKDIYIIDGDAAALMQMGTFATVGHYKNRKIRHILIDNNINDSTGGQPTLSSTVDFEMVAKACGYEQTKTVDNPTDLAQEIAALATNNKLSLIVVKCKKGSRKNLGRPTTTPVENKTAFMEKIDV